MQSIKCVIEDEYYYPLWSWLCPDCNSLISFYTVAPIKCEMCQTPILFDARQLITNVKERIKYHVQDTELCP